MLRPLVRLLIRRGVTFPICAEMLRDLYVDVARNELLSDPRARTDSRVSLLTGIHRKELRRQRETGDAEETVPEVVTLNSQIIARWLGAVPYVGADGDPRPLPRFGAAPSFESLVGSVTRDLRPRAVLDEWLAQGIVELTEAGEVGLHMAAFLPREGGEAQLFYFARNLHDHIAAASANVDAPGGAAPFFDRSVHYDRLGEEAAARLEALARQAAQRVLVEVNRAALEIADQDAAMQAPDRPTRRVNLGVFVYSEGETPDAP